MSVERDFEEADQTIPDRFPVLDVWLEQQAGRKPLADVTALLILQTLDRHLTVTGANGYQ